LRPWQNERPMQSTILKANAESARVWLMTLEVKELFRLHTRHAAEVVISTYPYLFEGLHASPLYCSQGNLEAREVGRMYYWWLLVCVARLIIACFFKETPNLSVKFRLDMRGSLTLHWTQWRRGVPKLYLYLHIWSK
jgi:hypothetical protein